MNRPCFRLLWVSVKLMLLVASPLAALGQSGSCPPDFGNGKLCTAEDFKVTGVVVTGPDDCTVDETIASDLLVGLTSTANQRYDVGLFFADNKTAFGFSSTRVLPM